MGAAEVLTVVVVAGSGLIRGITGFGGAMVMAPVLSLILGPVQAVTIALALETTAAALMLPDAWPKLRPRLLLYLLAPATFTAPIGVLALVGLDPDLARRLIGVNVVLFSLLLLAGFRYTGAPRPATTVALGGVAGVLLGATSVGAPPVIIYLLSGPDPHAVTRANLTVFVSASSVIGLVALFGSGAATPTLGLSAVLLCVPFLLGTWIGGKLFSRLTDMGSRRVALGVMLAGGGASLLL